MEADRKHKSGRRYDAGFKESAVGLVKSGRSFNEVAEDLGVSAWTIRMWVKRHDRGNAKAAITAKTASLH
jgi:transposase-like protein